MRMTRSKTSPASNHSTWSSTKAALTKKSVYAGSSSRRAESKTKSESQANSQAGFDLESDSDDDVPILCTRAMRLRRLARANAGNGGVIVDSKAALLFQRSLPTETHQLIASFLPRDQDVCNYRLICRTAKSCIGVSFWNERSRKTFDTVEGRTLDQSLSNYRVRQSITGQYISFDLHRWGGSIPKEIREVQMVQARYYVDMLKDVILESDGKRVADEDGTSVVRGLNIDYIRDLISGRNGKSHIDILDAVLKTSFDVVYLAKCGYAGLLFAHKNSSPDYNTRSLYTVQVCLASLSLHPDFSEAKVSHFDLSQYSVYALPIVCPIFQGLHEGDVNICWVLQAVNFFKYHLKADGEGLLAHAYKDLPKDQYPQPWIGKLQEGTVPLGSHWKGTHTYMDDHDICDLRQSHNARYNNRVYSDALDGGETFSDISIFFDQKLYDRSCWPKNWEEILRSSYVDNTNSKRKSSHTKDTKYFWGSSRGVKTGHFFGGVHDLHRQQGICGFQRIVLIKFYTLLGQNGEEVYDPSQVWAYEGCVLPGGNMIVGRWWDANDTANECRVTGPFIWWNVERSDAEPSISHEDALRFMDTF